MKTVYKQSAANLVILNCAYSRQNWLQWASTYFADQITACPESPTNQLQQQLKICLRRLLLLVTSNQNFCKSRRSEIIHSSCRALWSCINLGKSGTLCHRSLVYLEAENNLISSHEALGLMTGVKFSVSCRLTQHVHLKSCQATLSAGPKERAASDKRTCKAICHSDKTPG